ncbi:hypothetical protein PVK06_020420 [Gossypium arboreum]|uniref:DUF7745 domain-containing protein n=1 Tax=Gossypium arboreum TaxID=29729 RepID=A0ABR0PMI2_GOSAR|nr:hypothetical protein PVK06_020420 [Gossypium arboreum]
MTVVVAPLSGSEKLRLREVLASVQDSGSLSGYIRTCGFIDEHLFRALAQFWNPPYSCFTFGEVDLVPIVEEYTALLRCPRFQCDRIYSRAACVPVFGKKLMTITRMSE